MTRVAVTNNRPAPYGVELAGGGFRFLKPGETRTLDAANVPGLQADGVDFEIVADLGPVPDSLKAKVAGDAQAFDGFLDRSIPLITEDLPKQSDEGLAQLRADEEAGKSRKGVLAAIDAEIEARKQ